MKKMNGTTVLHWCGLILLMWLTAVACNPVDETTQDVPDPLPTAPTNEVPPDATDEGLGIDQPTDMSLYSSADLVFKLEEAGATVRLPTEPEAAAHIFSVPGQYINVGNERIQVYVYNSAELAGRDAARITNEGYMIAPLQEGDAAVAIDWVSPPHFYLFGNVIVLYVGEDTETLNLLESVLGPPLVGGIEG